MNTLMKPDFQAQGEPTRYHPLTTQSPIKVATQDVSVRYGDKPALENVSLEIPDRAVTAASVRLAVASPPSCVV